MNTTEAKKLVEASLEAHHVNHGKLTARTVSFSDLARASRIFVKVHGLRYPEPLLQKVEKDLKGTGVLLDPNH